MHEFPPGFDRFWSAYPRKTAKPKAAQAFAKLRPDEATLVRMLGAIAVQATSDQWLREGGQFIPHPATWLNQRRWEDEAQPLLQVHQGGPNKADAQQARNQAAAAAWLRQTKEAGNA